MTRVAAYALARCATSSMVQPMPPRGFTCAEVAALPIVELVEADLRFIDVP